MLLALKCSRKFCVMNERGEAESFKGEEQEVHAKFGRWDSKGKGRKLPGDRNEEQNSRIASRKEEREKI
jgi:hypothetical protein